MSLFLSIRFRGAVVQVGRGRHSGFLLSGVTKPLRAYVEPSRICLCVGFRFCWPLVFERILFVLRPVCVRA